MDKLSKVARCPKCGRFIKRGLLNAAEHDINYIRCYLYDFSYDTLKEAIDHVVRKDCGDEI